MLTSACVHVVDRSAGEREMDGWIDRSHMAGNFLRDSGQAE
jgi:hypothetical protein